MDAFPNGHMSMHFNLTPTGHSPAAATGTVNMKNLRCYTIGGSVAISQNLNVSGTVSSNGTVLTSDERVKENIELADLAEIQAIFDKVDVKTYERNDGLLGSRIGFIAQDFQKSIDNDSKFQNIVYPIYTEPPLIGLDMSRLTTLLWGVCKKQQQNINDLTVRLTALEKPKTTKSKKSSD